MIDAKRAFPSASRSISRPASRVRTVGRRMRISPETGCSTSRRSVAYFPMVADPSFTPNPVGYNLGLDFAAPFTYYQHRIRRRRTGFTSYLQAMDPVTGKQVWKSEKNRAAGRRARDGRWPGVPGRRAARRSSVPSMPGPARSSGAPRRDGDRWRRRSPTSSMASSTSPSSVGGSTAGRLLRSQLLPHVGVRAGRQGGVAAHRSRTRRRRSIRRPTTASADGGEDRAAERYGKYCAACHGDQGQTRGANFPDLTRTPLLHSQEGFDQVVLKGVRAQRGMASFAEALKPEDTKAIRAYIIARANDIKKHPMPALRRTAAAEPAAPGDRQVERRRRREPAARGLTGPSPVRPAPGDYRPRRPSPPLTLSLHVRCYAALMHVLLIEDSLDLSANVGEFLESRGHVVDYARDGQQGPAARSERQLRRGHPRSRPSGPRRPDAVSPAAGDRAQGRAAR